jgi:hypothetical protein
MAAAAPLGAAVSWQLAFPRGLLAALALASSSLGGVAQAAVHALVVAGLGGEPAYERQFADLAQQARQAAVTATGDAERVVVLQGDAATAAAVAGQLRQQAATLRQEDQLLLLFIGHGSFDGREYRFNLPGPDLPGSSLGQALDAIPAAQLVVLATSSSGALLKPLQRPTRVVVTATRSGGERNAVRFAAAWVQALGDAGADRDKDEILHAAEVFAAAERSVAASFKADAALATEHPQLQGTAPARFVVARLGRRARHAADAGLQSLLELQRRLEAQLEAVRAGKSGQAEAQYLEALEPVLLDLARLGVRIDTRERQLDTAAGSGGLAP